MRATWSRIARTCAGLGMVAGLTATAARAPASAPGRWDWRPASGEAECARQGARDDQRGSARAVAAQERRDASHPGRQPDGEKCDAAAGADKPVVAGASLTGAPAALSPT